MNRLKVAQYIALGATILSVLGLFIDQMGGTIGDSFINFGLLAGMVSYCFGGFGKALKMAGSISKWGILVPFPYKLITIAMGFMFAVLVFLFIPIIPVRKAYKESL